jgi:hypothetical protein
MLQQALGAFAIATFSIFRLFAEFFKLPFFVT